MLRTLLTAMILAAAPMAASASCFVDHSKQAMSCADGLVWDDSKAACVEATT